jgi:DNA-directed RNA polymerase specialized sigma24 family protein
LRLRYTDHLGIDQVARITGGHRATVARRLRRAEEELVEHARRLLGERTGAADDDLASVLRVLRSQLDLSIAAVFGPSTGAH